MFIFIADYNHMDMMGSFQYMWIFMIIGFVIFLVFVIVLLYLLNRNTSSIEPISPIKEQFKKEPKADEVDTNNQLKAIFCPDCGAKLKNSELLYCPSCGSRLK